MKKITDFIVNKRIIIFFLFLAITISSLFLSKNVIINRDITKYLPKTSETRIGMDIMDEEFKEMKTSTLNVMFKDLSNKEKDKIYKDLSSMKEVKEVLYDKTDNYNKDNFTLYEITANDSKNSKLASNLYSKIIKKYEDYDIETSGDISDEYKVVLPIWIVALAIFCALIILVIMCDSYIEPILFLIAIGMGVFINKGTNIIFPSISSITESISAILQLALSMDYSIMLMNRYRQEKQTELNNVKAMKSALYKSFTSISSSSVTTIVGLLALVFMSFTIGKDLGLVLAKGVLCSLLTIFTCLPFLILTFDKLITKTKKKSPVFKLNSLGSFAYKFRYFGVILFVIIFVASFLLKGNLKILYTDSDSDKVGKVFDVDNQIALVYKNKYEDKISEYCKTLEKDNKISEVLCYGNTINEPLQYQNLNSKLKDLGSDTQVDEYLLKIIYYNYYNKDEDNKMTFNEFVNFIKDEVYDNSEFNDKITNDIRKNVDKLSNFTNVDKFNVGRTTKEIADIFDISEDTVNDLLIYYNSINNNTKLTIPKFIEFMNNYVMNSKYSSNIDKNSLNKLNTVNKFTNKSLLTKEINSNKMSKLFDIDLETMKSLYLYYVTTSDINNKMTIYDFSNFVINNVLNNPEYSSNFNDELKSKINLLNTFSNENVINKEMTIQEMPGLLGIDEEMVSKVYLLYYGNRDNGTKLTVKQLIDGINYIKSIYPEYSDIDTSGILENLYNLEVTATQISQMLGIDEKQMFMIYALIDYSNNNTSTWVLTPNEFVSFILSNIDNSQISQSLKDDTIANLNTLQYVMNNTKTEYSYSELANSFNLSSSDIKNIYSLYVINTSEIKISPNNFVKYLLEHKNDEILAKNLSQSTIRDLTTINTVINSVLNDKSYTKEELSNLFGLDIDSMSLLYSLYNINYENKTITISYRDFINFLLNNIIPNEKYNSNFDSSKIEKINAVNKIINNTLNNVKYTKNEIFGIIKVLSSDVDKDLVDLLYIYYGSENDYNENWALTVEGFVNYLNDEILTDKRFDDFIDADTKNNIIDAKTTVNDAKNMLVGKNYSRIVLNTKYESENNETFKFMDKITKDLNLNKNKDIYLVGNTPMAYEMNKTFNNELNFITILTIIFIFIIVLFTFKSLLIPAILVILIQTAVYITMGILSFESGTVYFIALLIVQSILMGATIDYAILYTSYYIESRKNLDIKKSIINAYNNSIHTILTSGSILSLVTLVIGHFGSATASKICITISQGTICSTILILLILPEIISSMDKFIIKNK